MNKVEYYNYKKKPTIIKIALNFTYQKTVLIFLIFILVINDIKKYLN